MHCLANLFPARLLQSDWNCHGKPDHATERLETVWRCWWDCGCQVAWLNELSSREHGGVYADLVTAPVFKTGVAAEKSPGGFDSHPLP